MDWPDHGEPGRLDDIIEPLMDAFKRGATWKVKPGMEDVDVLWNGLPIPRSVVDADEMLGANWRRYEAERGRNFLFLMFHLAVLLGIEQGVRIERTHKRAALSLLAATLTNAGHALAQLRLGDERGDQVSKDARTQ